MRKTPHGALSKEMAAKVRTRQPGVNSELKEITALMNVESKPNQPEDIFREALLDELYGYHLFETEDRRYYLCQTQETGDSIWLAQSPSEEGDYQVRRAGEKQKLSSSQPVAEPCAFEHCVLIESSWAENGELRRIENELKRGGKALAQKANRAFVEVLMASVDVTTQAWGENLNAVIAQAVDDLAQTGFTADTLLFPKQFKGRFLVQQIVIQGTEIQSKHYAGKTTTGLRAFWSDDLQGKTVLIFDSTAGLTITQEPKFRVGPMRPFTVGVCGVLYLNPIVKNTGAVIAIEGIEQVLDFTVSRRASAMEVRSEIMYVDLNRIDELREIATTQFDLSKLVRLCEELNECYASECYLAVAMLTRAILDHIPPIFRYKKFAEVANNYGGAGRSFRDCMHHLENSSRKIADSYLHLQIRSKEVLPNKTQVNFSSDLDLLLAEIVRILR
jgi:hypothetical protein